MLFYYTGSIIKGPNKQLYKLQFYATFVQTQTDFVVLKTASSSALIKKSCVTFVPYFMHACTTSDPTNSYPWYSVC